MNNIPHDAEKQFDKVLHVLVVYAFKTLWRETYKPYSTACLGMRGRLVSPEIENKTRTL